MLATNYFFEGFRLLNRPGIRPYVIVPLLVNIIVFVSITAFAIQQAGLGMEWLMGLLPDWLSFLSWIIWPIFAVLMLIIYGYTFTMVSNFIAAPFLGLLSERVQAHLSGEKEPTGKLWQDWGKLILHALGRELRKLLYFLPRLLGVLLLCLILSFIPALNLLAPAISFWWGAWSLYLQYLDYPADNNQVTFKALLEDSRKQRKNALGFGGLVLLGSSIPLVNLLVIPAAVAGATVMWIDQKVDDQKRNALDSANLP